MQLVDALTIPSTEELDLFPGSEKATTASVASVSHLVESLANSPMSDVNQIRLALMVTRLFHVTTLESQQGIVGGQRRQIRKFDTVPLKRNAGKICEDAELFSGLQKDLQVCTMHTSYIIYR
jgi:hypothetical protein